VEKHYICVRQWLIPQMVPVGNFVAYTFITGYTLNNIDSIESTDYPSKMKYWDFNTSFVQCLFYESPSHAAIIYQREKERPRGAHLSASERPASATHQQGERSTHKHYTIICQTGWLKLMIARCISHSQLLISSTLFHTLNFSHNCWVNFTDIARYCIACNRQQTRCKKERIFLMPEQTYNLIVRFGGGGGTFPSARGQLSGRQLTGIQQYFRPAALMLLFCSSVQGARQIDTFI
jgi:hypothetical protein